MALDDEIIELIGVGAAADPGDGLASVYGVAGGILFDELFVARLFDAGGNFVLRRRPRKCLPIESRRGGALAA